MNSATHGNATPAATRRRRIKGKGSNVPKRAGKPRKGFAAGADATNRIGQALAVLGMIAERSQHVRAILAGGVTESEARISPAAGRRALCSITHGAMAALADLERGIAAASGALARGEAHCESKLYDYLD